jgi:HrpA-like RNA helicase
MGRAGRLSNGVCHRLYSKEEFDEMSEYTPPEILRSSLASVILTMKHMGVPNVERFDFIDRPSDAQWQEAHDELRMFGALDKKGVLTEYGIRMAVLPLDPYIANLLLSAEKQACTEEMATVAAFLSSQNVMLRPPGEEEAADDAHKEFEIKESDAFTWLCVWDAYQEHVGDAIWCKERYLNEEALIEIGNVRDDLIGILRKFGMKVNSYRNSDAVGRAITSGLRHNLFRKSKGGNSYFPEVGHGGREIFLHPGSSTYRFRPQFVVVGSIVETTRTYGRFCTAVKPQWLATLGISVKKEKEEEKRDDRKQGKRTGKKHKGGGFRKEAPPHVLVERRKVHSGKKKRSR